MIKLNTSKVRQTILLVSLLTLSAFVTAQQSAIANRDNCDYTVIMHKNTAPTGIGGWEGAEIQFWQVAGSFITSCTLTEGDYGEAIVSLPQEDIECKWMSGNNDYWINFEIVDPVGTEIFSGWGGNLQNPFFTFTSNCSQEIPAAPENLVVEGSESDLMASLSWTNPSSTQSGNPTTLLSVVVLRGDEIVHTIDNPEAGASETWEDNVPLPGIYAYSVYAVNENGNSGSATSQDTVGVYRVLPVSGNETITSCCATIVSEGDYLGLYPSNYNATITINPSEPNHLVKLFGSQYINGGEMGGTADHLFVYDGIGTSGELLADFTGTCFNGDTIDVTSLSGAITIHMIANGQGGCRGFNIYSTCTASQTVNELNDGNLAIYPNPADNQIVIDNENVEYATIYDVYGRSIKQTCDKVINTSEIDNGTYILIIRMGDGNIINKKIVIIH